MSTNSMTSGSILEAERKTPIVREVDVVVCGCGPAGFGAAMAAAKGGVDTLVIERYGFLGGGFTAQGISEMPTHTLVPVPTYGLSKPLVGGVLQELVERLASIGGIVSPSDVMEYRPRLAFKGHLPYWTNIDIEKMKYMMQVMVEEAGVGLLLHTLAVAAVVEKDAMKGVIIENKSGRQAIQAKIVIDATGDADIAAAAGAPYEQSPKTRASPMSLEWHLANVDAKKVPGEFIDSVYSSRKEIQKLLNDAIERGELPDPNSDVSLRRGRLGIGPPSEDVYGEPPTRWPRHGEAKVWGTSVAGETTDTADLTNAELETRGKVLSYLNFLRKNLPSFEEAYLSYTPPQIGLRESRRVVGEYFLTGSGDITHSRRHKDVVTRVFKDTPDSYKAPPPLFDIPYGCLVPLKIDNLMIAGRCISIDHEAATFLEPREEPTCMILGDAAGTAAALCVKNNVKPRSLDIKLLQRTLTEKGFNLYEPVEQT